MENKAIKKITGYKDGILLQYADGTFDVLDWPVIKAINEASAEYHEKLASNPQYLN